MKEPQLVPLGGKNTKEKGGKGGGTFLSLRDGGTSSVLESEVNTWGK